MYEFGQYLNASFYVYQQGANRQLWFASKQSLSYLDGRLVIPKSLLFASFLLKKDFD